MPSYSRLKNCYFRRRRANPRAHCTLNLARLPWEQWRLRDYQSNTVFSGNPRWWADCSLYVERVCLSTSESCCKKIQYSWQRAFSKHRELDIFPRFCHFVCNIGAISARFPATKVCITMSVFVPVFSVQCIHLHVLFM